MWAQTMVVAEGTDRKGRTGKAGTAETRHAGEEDGQKGKVFTWLTEEGGHDQKAGSTERASMGGGGMMHSGGQARLGGVVVQPGDGWEYSLEQSWRQALGASLDPASEHPRQSPGPVGMQNGAEAAGETAKDQWKAGE